MRLLKNKKGLDYMFLLAFVVLIVVVALYLKLSEKLSAAEGTEGTTVGGYAIALLKAQQNAEEMLFYIDHAGKHSSFKAVYELANRGGFGLEAPKCGMYNAHSFWNNKNTPKELCIPNAYNSLGEFINKNLNLYANAYNSKSEKVKDIPFDNYEFLIEENGITGIAIKDIHINIFTDESIALIGRYSFKPSFKVDFRTGLNDYAFIAKAVNAMVNDCIGMDDAESCVKSKIADTSSLSWNVKREGSLYLLDVAQSEVKPFVYDKNPVIQIALFIPSSGNAV